MNIVVVKSLTPFERHSNDRTTRQLVVPLDLAFQESDFLGDLGFVGCVLSRYDMRRECSQCGKLGRRARKSDPRLVRTVAYKSIVYLEITCGEDRANCECCSFKRVRTIPGSRRGPLTDHRAI